MAKKGKNRNRQERSDNRISHEGSALLDNLKVGLLSKDNWIDMGWAVAGGLFYVLVPTVVQRLGVRVNPPDASGESTYTVKWWDINGWPVLWIGAAGGMIVGAALRQPGFMAGALGTGIAHVMFTKLNKPVIKRFTGIYAARLDALSTSTMGDAGIKHVGTLTPSQLQPGATRGTVNGKEVVLYAPKAIPSNVTISPSASQPMADNHMPSIDDAVRVAAKPDTQWNSGWGTSPLNHY